MYTVSHSESFKNFPINHYTMGLQDLLCRLYCCDIRTAYITDRFLRQKNFIQTVASLMRKPLEYVKFIHIHE